MSGAAQAAYVSRKKAAGDRAVVWTDASSLAAGVVLKTAGGATVKDACWLRREAAASTHINMAELDAASKESTWPSPGG